MNDSVQPRRHRLIGAVISLGLCVLCVAGGFTVLAVVNSGSTQEAGAVEQRDVPERLANVKVQAVVPQTVEDRLELTGVIMPWEDITLSAEATGKIEWQGIEEGGRVEQGQELFRIDTKNLQALYDQAHAQHVLANQEFDRIQRLSGRGVTPERELDSAVAQRDVAAANLRAARIQLEKGRVYAPISGTVDTIHRKENEYIDTGMPLVRLLQLDRVKATAGIPERDVPLFAEGDAVQVALDSLPGQTFDGTIVRIATSAEMATRTFPAEIAVDNSGGVLKPGMIARITLVRRVYPDSVLIPMFAVISLEDTRLVYVEEDGVAQPRPVEIGIFQGGQVQIRDGLHAGDRLIVSGQRTLRPGQPVRVQEVL